MIDSVKWAKQKRRTISEPVYDKAYFEAMDNFDKREELANKVIELLKKQWVYEFTNNDAVRIRAFCLWEVSNDPLYPFSELDIMITAQEFELKYENSI